VRDGIRAAGERLKLATSRLRNWLRRVMPRVALVAALLFI
jgi:hypothetical protein